MARSSEGSETNQDQQAQQKTTIRGTGSAARCSSGARATDPIIGGILNVLAIVAVSYAVIAFFVRSQFYGGNLEGRRHEYARRVLSVYAVTLVVSALCLLAIGKLPLLAEPIVALKRTVLTSLPASFLATVVDGLH